ncbi:putative uncharacterized protein DDB_G0274435 [Microplitis demolitor]|uniref:putative uncharacterized protein DDB_G0274435 n=1 Tax=Microplitis demolitor TaxID=69319 RepID=UPI00235B63CD|nr:putative uncharacterized protein DDB_G0274435 [Microplitis demolitor]
MEENRQLNDEMQPMPRQRHSDDNNEDLQRLQRQQEQQLQEQRLKQRLEELQRQHKLRQVKELEEHRRRQRLVEQLRQQLQHAEDKEDQRIIDPVHIGGQIYVSSLSHTEAFRQYKPSKFITVMSHAIWGYRNLALRAVKITKRNQNKLPLTPEKRVVLEHQYHKFLKKKKKFI